MRRVMRRGRKLTLKRFSGMARVVRTFGGTTHMNFPTRCASILSSSSTVATLVDVMVATVGEGRWGRGLRCGGLIK
jgi:hypothetical protein